MPGKSSSHEAKMEATCKDWRRIQIDMHGSPSHIKRSTVSNVIHSIQTPEIRGEVNIYASASILENYESEEFQDMQKQEELQTVKHIRCCSKKLEKLIHFKTMSSCHGYIPRPSGITRCYINILRLASCSAHGPNACYDCCLQMRSCDPA